MKYAGKGWLVIVLFVTTLWLGGCATPGYRTTTYQSVSSSAGTVPRVDVAALSAPRVPPVTPRPAVLPATARTLLNPPEAETAVLREPAAEPPPRRRSRASTSRNNTRSRTRPAPPAAAPEPAPTPADRPAPAVPEPDTDSVTNGRYRWSDDGSEGPVKVVVNLDEQQAYVYRDDNLIGQSSVSTGRKGHRTPTGSFEILQKKRRHNSNLYNNAPMPYMQRLTWDGIALHGGDLPGYPASHGCIRLPMEFAKKLFETTAHGTQVVVTKGT